MTLTFIKIVRCAVKPASNNFFAIKHRIKIENSITLSHWDFWTICDYGIIGQRI